LQQKLQSLTKGPKARADLKFADYIHHRTGYTLDLFAGIRHRVDNLLKQDQNVDRLKHLFARQMHKEMAGKAPDKPKLADIIQQVIIAPDGRRKLTVTQWTDGKNASTYKHTTSKGQQLQ